LWDLTMTVKKVMAVVQLLVLIGALCGCKTITRTGGEMGAGFSDGWSDSEGQNALKRVGLTVGYTVIYGATGAIKGIGEDLIDASNAVLAEEDEPARLNPHFSEVYEERSARSHVPALNGERLHMINPGRSQE
jgi:hypothetical protein